MKALKITLVGIAGLLALFVGVGQLLPETAHVERSVSIHAPACNVYALVNGYQQFNRWSPWAPRDGSARTTLTPGPATGTGAKVTWTSENPQVGSGSQEITASAPCERVEHAIVYAGQARGVGTFRVTPAGEDVTLTWSFDTDLGGDLVGRYFGLRMDGMLGPDFEASLTTLKKLAEDAPYVDISALTAVRVTLEPTPLAYVTTSCPHPQVGKALGTAYAQIQAYLTGQGIRPTGPPLAIYTGATDSTYTIDAGVRIVPGPLSPAPDPVVRMGATPSGPMLRATHRGSYTRLGETHDRVAAYMAIHGLKSRGNEWEEFVGDPATTPEAQLLTYVYYPIE